MREKILAIALVMIGIIFVIEACFVIYLTGLVPPVMQAGASEFIAIAWGYAALKIIAGLIALAGGIYSVTRK
jgi:hypothetical protein